jgi:hypothetical protein
VTPEKEEGIKRQEGVYSSEKQKEISREGFSSPHEVMAEIPDPEREIVPRVTSLSP